MREALNTTVPTIGGAVGTRAPIDAQRSATGVSPLVCEIQIAGASHAMSLELPSAAPGGQNVVVQLTIGGEASSATSATPPVHTRSIPASVPNPIPAPIQASIPASADSAVPSVEEPPAPASAGLDSFAEVPPCREDLDQALPRITAEELNSYEIEVRDAAEGQEPFTYESVFELEPIDARQEMLASFREADRVRSRRVRRLRVASVSAMAAIGFCFCVAGLTGIFFEEGLPVGTTLASSAEQAESVEKAVEDKRTAGMASIESAARSGATEQGPSAAQPAEKSGTVEYVYITTAAEGGQVKVSEFVEFDVEGFAKTSHMTLAFESEDAALAFMSRVSSDYGKAYLGGNVEGCNVEVRVDVSENRLSKNAYRQTLAQVAQELTVTEGSGAGPGVLMD